MGTPAEIPGVGYWEERVTDSNWSKHTWTIYENASLGTREEIDAFLTDMARSMGGEDEPRFQREYRGKRVPPKNADRPYIYDPTKQDWAAEVLESVDTKTTRFTRWALPLKGDWRFIFGIDLGHKDASAIAVWGVTDASPATVWLVEEFIAVKMLPDALWAKVNERRAVYHPLEMAVDEGGLGKMIAEQWRAPPYSLPVVPADKDAPEVQADFLSAAMSRGAVKISKHSRMAADMAVAQWDGKLLEKGKRRVALQPHSDIIPAGRYGFKKAHAIAMATHAPPVPKTVEQREVEELARERREGARRARYGAELWDSRAALGRWKR
jgi:hypothetical protein